MATTQANLSRRREDTEVTKRYEKIWKQLRLFASLLSKEENHNLKTLTSEGRLIQMIENLDMYKLEKLKKACQKKELKKELDDLIKKDSNFKILEFLLEKFEYEKQYEFIAKLKESSAEGFLMGLTEDDVATMRLWRKLKLA